MYNYRLYSSCKKQNEPITLDNIDTLHQEYEKLVSDFNKLKLKIYHLEKHFVQSNARRQANLFKLNKSKE